LGTNRTFSIIEIAKMFNRKIKFLPQRKGDRFGSITKNNNSKKILGYEATRDIRNYVKEFIRNN